MKLVIASVLVSTLAIPGLSDMYLHWPRGSNNRLNEASANRNNANRMFDSQNNNRGGYNVGDLDPENGFNANDWMADFDEMYNFDFLNNAGDLEKQYEMLFFENSWMSTTWTNQHGTGNQKLNSHIVLQFVCDTFPRADQAGNTNPAVGPDSAITTTDFAGTRTWMEATQADDGSYTETTVTGSYTDLATALRKHGLRVELYNGGNTNTPDEPQSIQDDNDGSTIQQNWNNNANNNRGRRESEEYYSLCKSRSQQYGLFHADQDLQGDSQKYTRQNPGGTRRGLECPEERDYYPWWNPSPFHDIAILTPDVDYCESDIAPNSQNVAMKFQCVRDDVTATDNLANWVPSATAVEYNLNASLCNGEDGHAYEGIRWNADAPECVDSYWSKVNHLGNVDSTQRGGKQASYDWQLPSYDYLVNNHYCYPYTENVGDSADSTDDTSVNVNCVRMMFRIRYNMSTMDYDPYQTSSEMDEDDDEGIISPIENNPTVDVGVYAQGLRLAINTAQTGRTFQDNTHTFNVCERPQSSSWDNSDLMIVGVRGKRGNIVQTFPATEYDFEPQHIEVDNGQCMHFQWTGSNTHNNGAPGGDGQTGDAGEGRGGSDRSNIVQSRNMRESYPVTYDVYPFAEPGDDVEDSDSLMTESGPTQVYDFFDFVQCYHPLFPNAPTMTSADAQLVLGSAGFYRSVAYAQSRISNEGENAVLDELLNNVSGAFKQGLICCVTNVEDSEREFSFISTRNNNFTNRSQKFKIVITDDPDDMSTW